MINLDNNATTRLAPEVIELIQKELLEGQGNPSSIHGIGREARAKLTKARREIASFFSCTPQEVLFNSSATEGLNTLIFGSVKPADQVITSAIEHSAVSAPLAELEKKGVSVIRLPCGKEGCVSPSDLRQMIDEKTSLIVIQAVNSETGVINDLEELSDIAYQKRVPFIVDGVAALGKIPLTWFKGISAWCFSGHKIHGPLGVGFSLVRPSFRFTPLIFGGGQEYGKRSGSENVMGCLALAKAVELSFEGLEKRVKSIESLRDFFEESLIKLYPKISVNGLGKRVCNTTNLCFHGMDGETLLMRLDQLNIAASLGSACSTGALQPSKTLLEMGLTQKEALSSLRFSLSRFTTREEIEEALLKFKLLFST